MKQIRQITVIGLGLLGASVGLAVSRMLTGVKVVGFSHRAFTCAKARQLNTCHEVADSLTDSVKNSDIVILATPILTFKDIFTQIADYLPKGCIVTDVGSTKLLVHQWAKETLPKGVWFIGSHPIAGSEQRGVEFARDDLFIGADCIMTAYRNSNGVALNILNNFWSQLGSRTAVLNPASHDRLLANISHLPHVTAAALLNANNSTDLKMAGKGFIDTSRVASGPASIWTDILITNSENIAQSIDRLSEQLKKLRKAIKTKNAGQIETLLEKARAKRAGMIAYKLKKKDIIG